MLRDAVSGFIAPDRGQASGYLTLTEYFDSPDHLFHWQKVDGFPNRRRLRSRIYIDPQGKNAPVAFIEIKHKLNGITVKRRTPSTPLEIIGFSLGKPLTAGSPTGDKVREEINRLTQGFQLSPRAQIRYHRHAYDMGPEGSLRVTFDHDVRSRVHDLNPLSTGDCDFETPLTPAGASLMEVKTIGPVPPWFRQLCATFSLVPCSFSKYTAALGRFSRDAVGAPVRRRHAVAPIPVPAISNISIPLSSTT